MWPENDQQSSRIKEVLIPNNVTTAIIDKLTPNTRNKVRILAYNGKYNSAPSDDLYINTPEGGLSFILNFLLNIQHCARSMISLVSLFCYFSSRSRPIIRSNTIRQFSILFNLETASRIKWCPHRIQNLLPNGRRN